MLGYRRFSGLMSLENTMKPAPLLGFLNVILSLGVFSMLMCPVSLREKDIMDSGPEMYLSLETSFRRTSLETSVSQSMLWEIPSCDPLFVAALHTPLNRVMI